jgi:hypothetical protein
MGETRNAYIILVVKYHINIRLSDDSHLEEEHRTDVRADRMIGVWEAAKSHVREMFPVFTCCCIATETA